MAESGSKGLPEISAIPEIPPAATYIGLLEELDRTLREVGSGFQIFTKFNIPVPGTTKTERALVISGSRVMPDDSRTRMPQGALILTDNGAEFYSPKEPNQPSEGSEIHRIVKQVASEGGSLIDLKDRLRSGSGGGDLRFIGADLDLWVGKALGRTVERQMHQLEGPNLKSAADQILKDGFDFEKSPLGSEKRPVHHRIIQIEEKLRQLSQGEPTQQRSGLLHRVKSMLPGGKRL